MKDIINQLKIENKLLFAENKNLKSAAKQGCGDVEAEIADLWVEFRRLKKANMKECEEAKKYMVVSYYAVIISWCFFFLVFLLV